MKDNSALKEWETKIDAHCSNNWLEFASGENKYFTACYFLGL